MNCIKIFPSLISSNLLNLEKTITELSPYCDGFHIDIMDNHFVPNLTWGPPVVNHIAQATNKPLSFHLMVQKPATIIDNLTTKKGDCIIIHVENENAHELLKRIRAKNCRVGIAIKPSSNLESLLSLLDTLDQVLLMSVEPGFSGQIFLPESYQRLQRLTEYKTKHNLPFEIVMDGGITLENIHKLVNRGCTMFCIASAIFSYPDPVAALKKLYETALKG